MLYFAALKLAMVGLWSISSGLLTYSMNVNMGQDSRLKRKRLSLKKKTVHLSQLLDEQLKLRVAKEGGEVTLMEPRSHCGCAVHQ